MNKKLFFNIYKVAICALVLSCVLTACSDDNDNDDADVVLKVREEMKTISFSSNSDQKEISITTKNTDFTVQVIEGSDWLSVRKESKSKIIVSVTENTTDKDRIGTIRVTSTTSNDKYLDITVSQPGSSDSYTGKSTNMLLTLICPDEDLDCADFVVSYISDKGDIIEQKLTKADFKSSQEKYITYSFSSSGISQIGIEDNEKYWQVEVEKDKFDENSKISVRYVVKDTHMFHSKAGISVRTSENHKEIDKYSKIHFLNADCIYIYVGTGTPNYPNYFWFGESFSVNKEGVITETDLKEDDFKHLSESQYTVLADCVNKMIDAAYDDIDKIIASLSEDDFNYSYSELLPGEVFGEDLDVKWELTSYNQDKLLYVVNVKKATGKNWNRSYGNIETNVIREQLNDEVFRTKVVRMYELAIINMLSK